MDHAFISPSSAHRTYKCAASATRSFQVYKKAELMREIASEFYGLSGDDSLTMDAILADDNGASSEGTAFHEIFEGVLNGDIERKRVVKAIQHHKDISENTADDEFILDRFPQLIDEAMKHMKDMDESWVERKVKVKGLPQFGHVDLVSTKGRVLYVSDLKTGYLDVQAEENPQLMTYGVGLLDEMGWDSFDKVVFEIIGMRWANSTWECSVQTLKDFKHDVMLPAFVAAHSINPKATTGDHCRYCIAKIHCKEWLTEFSEYDNESFSYEDIHDMPTEEAEELFYRLKQAEALRKQLSDELLERFDGFDPPKRVTRVAPSAIIKYSVSEDELIDALADKLGDVNDLYNQKLKTPKELIKLLGDDALKELTMEQWRKPYIRS